MSNYAVQTLRRAGIPEPVARSVASKLKIKSYDAQHIIWTKGGQIDSWQFIMSGLVAAAAPTQGAQSIPIKIYGPGSWFGEQPILNRMPSYLEFSCLTPTQVITMPTALLWEIFDTEPGFSRYIAKLTAWRVQKATEMLMLMKLGNPCLRVVMGIAQFAEALASRSERPPTDGLDGGIEIPVKQNVIASLCGVSRTLVSEYLQRLAADCWLSVSYGRIELLSIGVWQRFTRSRRVHPMHHTNPTMDELLIELYRASVV
ncbi:Crp/Fnr family transcriptional regulator [Polaromonas sp. JS666]|uniref:Crp/Fnr family transcriptional regulator n=1 Tax=Polaromonas sp. (strain JS666 / ATCC BAA-500) TaxID=296591 RepID=UPI000046467B|nr:Crp/Fnr family transcriptional regulator [Polaromonas sp. JS666]ABE47239.1 cyclic nucleotide-binding domain (cNMP-BD) protein [Polaromonas sp. JS666]